MSATITRPRPASPARRAFAGFAQSAVPAEISRVLGYPSLCAIADAFDAWRVPMIEPERLSDEAVAFRNASSARGRRYGDSTRAGTVRLTLARWQISYLRHAHSPYDQAMTCARWLVDPASIGAVQLVISRLTGDEITRVYPQLSGAVSIWLAKRQPPVVLNPARVR